jgi:putative membrane protein
MGIAAWVMMAHIVTLGTWSAALLVLAGLYASAPEPRDRSEVQRHRVLCRFLFVMVASPAAILTIISGTGLAVLRGAGGDWLLGKLAVVALLVMYHAYCGKLFDTQGMESHRVRPRRRHPLLVALPLFLITVIFVLVLAKPHLMLEYQLAPQPAGHRHQRGAEQGQTEAAEPDRVGRIFQTG